MMAIWNSLKLADEAGLVSLLFPPIANEMLGFNAKICADVMLPAIRKYLLNQNKNLKNISKGEVLGLSYATDATHLINADNPIPFVIFGPGDPNNIHKINEFIELEQIFQAIQYLTNALLQTYSKDKD